MGTGRIQCLFAIVGQMSSKCIEVWRSSVSGPLRNACLVVDVTIEYRLVLGTNLLYQTPSYLDCDSYNYAQFTSGFFRSSSLSNTFLWSPAVSIHSSRTFAALLILCCISSTVAMELVWMESTSHLVECGVALQWYGI